MRTSRSRYSTIKDWYHRNVLLHVVASFRKRDFAAAYFPTIDALNRSIIKTIPKSASIDVPRSPTIRELGIIGKLKQRGNRVLQHWRRGLTEKIDRAVRHEETCADHYITSANAITMEGDIINTVLVTVSRE